MTKKEQVIDTDGQTLIKIADSYGTIEYRNTKHQTHRIGGPAYIGAKGYQAYYAEDRWHCLDGPARIWPDGTNQYWVKGKRHRIDGPAIIRSNGTQSYWVNGIEYTEEQYPQAVIAYKLKQLVG